VAGTIFVLTGPTAVGKTEWALRWAESRRAEIVSCDSLLFYRGMDIGTAKPTPEEQQRVRHHLIDICDVNERINVVDYVERARTVVSQIQARNRKVLVTGGSGFYLACFFGPVGDHVQVSPDLRNSLRTRLEREGLPALVRALEELNPDGLGTLDTSNPRRVLPALERCLSSGRTLASLAEEFSRQPGPFAGCTVRLTRLDDTPEALAARIDRRVEQMLKRGLVAEVRSLRGRGLESNPSASRAIGYRETLAMLDGCLPVERLSSEIASNTRKLVKKQRTWFRTQLPEHRVVATGKATLDSLFSGE